MRSEFHQGRIMNKSKLMIALLTVALLGSTAIAFNLLTKKSTSTHPEIHSSALAVPQFQDDAQRQFSDANRVRAAALSSDLRSLLRALGDRLEKPGKERVTCVGMLYRSGENRAAPFTLTWETPGKIRLQDFGRQQTTVFDGNTVFRSAASSTALDQELLETLVFDSAEHVFLSQMEGKAMRSLGSRFRNSEDSRGEYAGSFYDIFELTEPVPWDRDSERTRQYWFNSDTQVLERVKYRISSNGLERSVEVRLTNWREVSGQRWPSRVVRLENDTPVFSLDFNPASTVISARVDDGTFSHAPNNQ